MFGVKKYTIYWILLGALAFSPFGVNLCKDIMGLPTAFPEPFVIVFLIFMRKQIKPLRIDRRLLIRYFFVFVFLLCCALVYDLYLPKTIIANARGWLYMFAVMTFFQKQNIILDIHIAYLCLGIFIGWLMSCLFSLSFMMSEGEFMGTTGSLLAIPLFFTITYMLRKNKLFTIGLFLVLLISVISGVRRTFVVLIITLFLIFLFAHQKKGKKRFFAIFILIVGIASFLLPYFKSFTYEVSPLLYARVFERYSVVDDNDQTRIDALNGIFLNMSDNLLPKGFYSSRPDVDGTGIFIDMPISGLIHIFGIPITLLLLFYFVTRLIKLYRKYKKTGSVEYFIYCISLLIMFMMLFFEGSFIAVLYATPLTGLCLGRILYLTKTKYNT